MIYHIRFGSEGKIAKWHYILQLFRIDNSQTLRQVPKLTISHIYLTPFNKMSGNLASQLLSNSVRVAIRNYILIGKMPSAALETAEFVEQTFRSFEFQIVINIRGKTMHYK